MKEKTMRITRGACALLLVLPLVSAHAGSKVLEGDEAQRLYEQKKGQLQTLVQKDTSFHLRKPGGGAEEDHPATITVKAGEIFFITNEEAAFVHNVYDESDASWVLKKQVPSSVAALSFDTPGQHKLRCAIHPKMQITVDVTG